MKTEGNTILITGGATGIGFALAEAFIKKGNKVLICGRRKSKLEEDKEKLTQIQIQQCDLATPAGRVALFNWINDSHKDLNILINNAGVQKAISLKRGKADLFQDEDEIQTNFIAPIYLSAYFTPMLIEKKEAAIVNISSGLGFIPIADMPIYCATKSGIHMFTVSLRYQLRGTSIKVFEIVPPAVDTELGKGTTGGSEHRGISPSEVAEETIKALKNNNFLVVIDEAKKLFEGSKTNFEKVFQELNSWRN